MYRVLLVEDDPRLAELVTEYLSGYEFSVDLVTRGDTALEHFKQSAPDIVVLDLMLPGDGWHGRVPPDPRAVRGADPDPDRARRHLRRSLGPGTGRGRFRQQAGAAARAAGAPARPAAPYPGQGGAGHPAAGIRRLRIMANDRSVSWRGQPCVLSNTEYKLLLVLAEAAGRVLSRDELLKKMRGIEFDGLDRSIDNCISKLRKKFDDNLSEKIKTVWGEGYLFSPSAWN
jgi:two-component system OmpR family response regulator